MCVGKDYRRLNFLNDSFTLGNELFELLRKLYDHVKYINVVSNQLLSIIGGLVKNISTRISRLSANKKNRITCGLL